MKQQTSAASETLIKDTEATKYFFLVFLVASWEAFYATINLT